MMVNVHFICFADTVLLHTEKDNYHHLLKVLFYNALPRYVPCVLYYAIVSGLRLHV